ncbi:MAG: rhodanese-like domain-containing protein [Bacteroidetes bacterium]|nr:rhodanese-like domain-containing protein [Bacteroidota bacterium]MBK8144864.1 rhodanese-like domain-containing protein [Bacteroidota bacterium]MBP6314294.1 rhodanese-like domain-containing protein [Chitinophagaceae bacterium]
MGFFSNLFGSNVSNEELANHVKGGAMLVDVRSQGEFASGSAKGAINIPLDVIQGQIATFKNKKHIVVFCRSGNRSGQAKAILNQNGITNVSNGGTWQDVLRLQS